MIDSNVAWVDGEFAHTRCFTRDVTAQHAAEEALRRSEQHLSQALQATAEGVWEWNLQTGEVRYSRRWIESLGYSVADVPPHVSFWESIVHPDDMPQVMEKLREHLDGRSPSYVCENRLRTRSGEYRWNLDRGMVVDRDASGKPLRMVGTDTDITERKEAERTRALLAAIVESSGDAIISKTLDGTILTWNTAAERLFGYSAGEVVGRSIHVIIPPERRDQERELFNRLGRGERIEHYETVRVNRDGRRLDVSLSISPVRDGSGAVVGVSSVARDITFQKQEQEALRQRAEEVQALIETLPIGVFIALDPECRRITGNEAAHRILQTGPDVNLSKSAPPADRPTHFRICRDGRELAPEELPVQRAARGEHVRDEEVEHVFADGTVRYTVLSAEPLFDSSGRVRGAVAGVLDITDRKRAEQTVRSLLAISAKLTSTLDVDLLLELLVAEAIRLIGAEGGCSGLRAAKEMVAVISVRDTGLGIPPDMLQSVFDMFAQVEHTRGRSQGGLGIGLTLAKSIVEMHGGRIQARSEGAGKGSEFIIRLPLAASDLPMRTKPGAGVHTEESATH